MSKFDKTTKARTAPDAKTALGGVGFSRDLKQELVLLGASNAVGETTYHESASARDDRFERLVHEATLADPEWTAEYVAWLRQDAGMRSAALVAAAEYVAAGGPNGASVVEAALQRPDEPGEMLAYWTVKHNKKRRGIHFPKPIKRGVARSAVRLYNEKATFKTDGKSKNWRFADVIALTRPSPKDERQSALFAHLLNDRRGGVAGPDDIPEALYQVRTDYDLLHLDPAERRDALHDAIEIGWPWERIAGWVPGGLDAEVWEAAIPNMGIMALIKNLRNFDEANISDEAVAQVKARITDFDEVRRSHIFPIRIFSAWKNLKSLRWADALETCLAHTLHNVPSLPGRTLVLIDVSDSMRDDAISAVNKTGSYAFKRGDGSRPFRWEVAGLFGIAIAARAANAEVVLFNSVPVARFSPSLNESVLRRVENLEQFVGGGTDTLGALAAHFNGHDQVVIITDEQTGPRYHRSAAYQQWVDSRYRRTPWDAVKDIKAPVTTYNLAGYPIGHSPVEDNWLTLGGLNDASFKILERGDSEAPWRS